MSIDPYTGRNPSYGFVELASKAQADRAMRELSGEEILGRAVKLGPGVARSKKRQSSGHSKREDNLARPVFERWSRIDAPDHFQGYSDQGRRLWVGGLPRMADHNSVNEGIRELFAGFEM